MSETICNTSPLQYLHQVAATFEIRFRGTLGLLLDAIHAGLVSTITPLVDQLQALRFRRSSRTRDVVLALADETA